MSYTSHHGPPNFLELFFCQKVQMWQKNQPMVWVVCGEDRATTLETPYDGYRNNLHFSVSEAQPAGEIVVESVQPGLLKLDASSGMHINTHSHWYAEEEGRPPRVNDSLQRVKKYKLVIPTPLTTSLGSSYYEFADHKVRWRYPHPASRVYVHTLTVDDDDYQVNTSGILDATETFQEGTVDLTNILLQTRPWMLNHWWIDNTDIWEPREASVSARMYWRTLTTDSSQFHVNSLIPDDDDTPNIGSVDTESYFTPLDETYRSRDYDTGWHGRTITNINVENVPSCPLEISYWVNKDNKKEIVSVTIVPLPGRGWLPAPRFGEVMENCEILPLAFGLLALCAQNRLGVLVDVLNELIYQWAVVYENVSAGNLNPNGWGLMPDRFSRFGNQPQRGFRSVYAYSWLGMALCKAAEMLTSTEELPLLPLLLRQIALFVAYNVDTATGIVFDGYQSDDFISTSHSLQSAAVAGIFLNEYLQLDYHPLVHNRLCRIQERLHHEPLFPNPEEDWDQYNRDMVAYIAYLDYYQAQELYRQRLLRLMEQLQTQWEERGEIPKDLAVWYAHILQLGNYAYVNPRLDRERWQVQRFLQRYDRNLAGFLHEDPSLIASSWWVLSTAHFRFYLRGRFQSNFLEVCAYRDQCFLVMRAFWPFGYLSTNPEKEQKQGGVIGSLLFALAEVNYHWFALYTLLRDGITVSKAQGWVLDAWGESLECRRQGLEPDHLYRQRVAKALKERPTTEAGMRELLDEYFAVYNLEEGGLPEVYWRKDQTGQFVREIWRASPEQIEQLPERDGKKGIYLRPQEDSFVPLHELVPRVTVSTPVALAEGVRIAKKGVPAGVPLELITLTGTEDFSSIDTVYYIADVDWDDVLSEQNLSFDSGLELTTVAEVTDEDEAEAYYQPNDANAIKFIYVPSGERAWLEDGTEVEAEGDLLLIVPKGIEVNYGLGVWLGKVIISPGCLLQHYYGTEDIYFYSRDGGILRLEPSRGTLVIQ